MDWTETLKCTINSALIFNVQINVTIIVLVLHTALQDDSMKRGPLLEFWVEILKNLEFI